MDLKEWCHHVGGLDKAAKVLGVTERCMMSWYYGERIPRPECAYHIIQCSNGLLDFNGIYEPMVLRRIA